MLKTGWLCLNYCHSILSPGIHFTPYDTTEKLMNKINIVYIHLKMDGPYFIPVLKNFFVNFVRSKNKPEIVGKKKKGKVDALQCTEKQ